MAPLDVATTGKPAFTTRRALATSHALGRTNGRGPRWRRRSTSARSARRPTSATALTTLFQRRAVHDQRHVDIAARRARVRAQLMGAAHQVCGLFGIGDGWQGYVELGTQLEGAVAQR